MKQIQWFDPLDTKAVFQVVSSGHSPPERSNPLPAFFEVIATADRTSPPLAPACFRQQAAAVNLYGSTDHADTIKSMNYKYLSRWIPDRENGPSPRPSSLTAPSTPRTIAL